MHSFTEKLLTESNYELLSNTSAVFLYFWIYNVMSFGEKIL